MEGGVIVVEWLGFGLCAMSVWLYGAYGRVEGGVSGFAGAALIVFLGLDAGLWGVATFNVGFMILHAWNCYKGVRYE